MNALLIELAQFVLAGLLAAYVFPKTDKIGILKFVMAFCLFKVLTFLVPVLNQGWRASATIVGIVIVVFGSHWLAQKLQTQPN